VRPLAALQPSHLERVSDPLLQHIVFQAVRPAIESKILQHRQVIVQTEALRHIADARPDFRRVFDHRDAQDFHCPGGRSQQPEHHADGGRLAGAVGAQETEDLPTSDLEVDPRHGSEVAEAFGQATSYDGEVVPFHTVS
jgi:hypothetical protein